MCVELTGTNTCVTPFCVGIFADEKVLLFAPPDERGLRWMETQNGELEKKSDRRSKAT